MKKYLLSIAFMFVGALVFGQRTTVQQDDIVIFKYRGTTGSGGIRLVDTGTLGFLSGYPSYSVLGKNDLGSSYGGSTNCGSGIPMVVYNLDGGPVGLYQRVVNHGTVTGNVDDTSTGGDKANAKLTVPYAYYALNTTYSSVSDSYSVTAPTGTYQLTEKYTKYNGSGNIYEYNYTSIFTTSTEYYCDNGSIQSSGTVGNFNLHIVNKDDVKWSSGYTNTVTVCDTDDSIDLTDWVDVPYGQFWIRTLSGDTVHNAIVDGNILDATVLSNSTSYTLSYILLEGFKTRDQYENAAFKNVQYGTPYSAGTTDAYLTKTINVKPTTITYFDLPDQICQGQVFQLLNYADEATGGTTTFSGNGVDNTAKTLTWNTTGTFTITLNYVDEYGCDYTFTDDIEFGDGLTVNTGGDKTICVGGSTQLLATGGDSYSWSPITGLSDPTIANPVANPTSTTTYTVSVNKDGFCQGTAAVKVTVNPLPSIVAPSDQIICNGESVQLTATGGVSYAWTPATGLSSTTIANPIASPAETTTYTVTGTDANGCVNTDQVQVTVKPSPSGSVQSSNLSICIGESVQLVASGGTSYSWNNGFTLSNATISNPIATPTSTTVYTVTITGANGCQVQKDVIVTVNGLPTANAGSDVNVCVGQGVSLSGSGAGTGGAYSWSPSTGLNNPNIQNPIASPGSTTDYTLTVTNTNGCTDTDIVRVNVLTPAALTISADNVVRTSVEICKGESTQLRAIMSGAQAYSWSPVEAISNAIIESPTVSPTTNTTYSVTVTDNNGCQRTASIDVIVNDLPDGQVDFSSTSICLGQSVQLFASGGTSYSWTGSNLSNASIANPIVSPTTTTVYEVTIGSAKGCTVKRQVVVTVNSNPIALAGSDVEMCEGENVSLFGSGAGTGGTYSWSPSTGLNNPNIHNPTASPANTTDYTLTVTNANGCTATDVVRVVVNKPGNVITSINGSVGSNASICTGSSATLNASMANAVSYEWTPSTGLNNANIASPVASPTSNTTYTVKITDNKGCFKTGTVSLTVNPLPLGEVSFATASICSGEAIQLEASGGTSYLWSGGSLSGVTSSSPTVQPTASTTYSVDIFNSQGCKVTKTVVVTVNPLPQANAGNDVNVCVGQGVSLSGSGAGAGGSYSWTPSTGLNNANLQNPIASPSTTTDYTLTVTNSNGCTSTDVVRVNVLTPAALTISADNVIRTSVEICKGESTQLRAIMSGAQAYSWSPVQAISSSIIENPTVSPTVNTTYSVTVTDNNGCQRTAFIDVVVNDPPEGGVVYSTASLCLGESIELQAFGGVSYGWTGGNLSNASIANPIASPITTTVYEVTIASAKGCTVKKQVVVTVNGNPTASAGSDVEICEGGSTSLFGSGAGVGGTYSWVPSTGLSNPNVQNPTASPLTTTEYTLTVTNSNGCTATDIVRVLVNKPGNVATTINGLATTTAEICLGSGANLSASMANAVSYEWTPSTGLNNPNIASPVASPTTNTTYTVKITDNKGCSRTGSVSLTVNPLPTGDVSFATASICSGEAIQLEASGGASYLWSGGSLTGATSASPTVSPTTSTTYSVDIFNSQGCKVTKTVGVTVNPLPNAMVGTDKEICLGGSVQISASGAGAGGSYTWSPQSSLSDPFVSNPIASPGSTTTYSVLVTNASGCTSTKEVTVTVNSPGNVLTYADTNLTSEFDACIGSTVQLKGEMANAVSYSWSPSTGLNNASVQSPIATITQNRTYTVTITDNNGCQRSSSILLNALQNPNLEFSGPLAVCKSDDPIDLRDYVNLSNVTFSGPGVSGVMFDPSNLTPGVTFVTGQFSSGECGTTAQLEINVLASTTAGAGNDIQICLGSSGQLTATGGVSYSWSPSTGLSSSVISNPIASPSTTTLYTVTAIGANGCEATDEVLVTVASSPTGQINTPKNEFSFGELVSFGFSQSSSLDIAAYNWNLGNGVTSTAASPSFYYYQSGSMNVSLTVTTADGCQATFSKTIEIGEPGGIVTGIDDLEDVKVYPNPFSSAFIIESSKQVSYAIYDFSGRAVLEGKLKDQSTPIDASLLSEGTYILRLFEGAESKTFKLIKK